MLKRLISIILLCCIPLTGITATSKLTLETYLVESKQLSLTESKKISKAFAEHSNNIDKHLILAIIEKESRYQIYAKSSSGSKGLMQVQQYWHRDKIKGRNLYDPSVNIEVGVRILEDCQKRWKRMEKILSCYNGGGDPKYAQKVLLARQQLISQVSFS